MSSGGLTLGQGLQILALASDVISGRLNDKLELARRLAYLGLDLAPVDDLKGLLTEEARKRDEIAVDIAEDIKFGAP